MTDKPADPDVCERCGGRAFFWDNFKPERQCRNCDPIIVKHFHTVMLVELPDITLEQLGKPCFKCGNDWNFWWNMKGQRRCGVCTPPVAARKLLRFNEDQAKREKGIT